MSSNPTVVSNCDRFRKFDIVDTTLDICFMRCCKDTDVRSEHGTVSDSDKGTVKNGQIEVGVDSIANLNVTAVIQV